MDPTVVAAWIAAGVSVLTLVGTLVAQYVGHRVTSKDAEKTAADQREKLDRTFAEQRDQLDRTLAEQRDQLDRTLDAQNRQLDRTLAEQRTRTFNERFATAAEQLGSDRPAVRLAGVYAMAGLADDWEENRQVCGDVLCAYLRMPYIPEPGQAGTEPQRLAFQAGREVRHTVIRVITAHLRNGAAVSWQGLDLDFTGVVFDGGDFSGARFSGDWIDFTNAQFSSGTVNFDHVAFSSGTITFSDTQFSGSVVHFTNAEVAGVTVVFNGAEFSDGTVSFVATEFSSNGIAAFNFTEFSGGTVNFTGAEFSGGLIQFTGAKFSGSDVSFNRAEFSGGAVDFSHVLDWSVPPAFPWTDTPPLGVKLPENFGNPDLLGW
jgi:uncharacterized protein YjbI with pentapeptide repeats